MVTDAPITVLLTQELPGNIQAQAQTLSPRLQFTTDLAQLGEAEIIYGNMQDDWWARAERLKWVQTFFSGVERLLTPAAKAHPAVITNARIHGEPIAEHLFGMLLMLTRQLHIAYQLQMEHRWTRVEMPDILTGKTLGMLGTGVIGQRTAEIGKAFGMRVLGMRRSGEAQPPFDAMYTPAQKAEMLPQCDYLMLALPLTPETEHYISTTELTQMKPGALLFNIGRGKLIDTDALLAALRSGHLGGAGLDVTDPEPLPADHPLWGTPNVIITPHYAGIQPQYDQAAGAIFLDNLRRYLNGQPLMSVVDKQAGY